MKKIIAIISIICIVFSLFCLPVSAENNNTINALSLDDYEYFYPENYPNITLMTVNNTEKWLIFTEDNVELYIYNGYYVMARNKTTSEAEDFYYLNCYSNMSYWDICERLTKESEITQAVNAGVGGQLGRFMGTKRFPFGHNSGITVTEFAQTYYAIKKHSIKETYNYYNHPSALYENTDYILFKRPNDTNYILMYRQKNGNNTYVDYEAYNIKTYNNKQNTLFYDSNTYWLEFATKEEAYNYMFDDTSVSRHTKLNYTTNEHPQNTIALSGQAAYYIADFTSDTEIVNNTLSVVNTTTGETLANPNPKSYDEWYNEKNGISANGEYYFIAEIYNCGDLKHANGQTLPNRDSKICYALVTTDNIDNIKRLNGAEKAWEVIKDYFEFWDGFELMSGLEFVQNKNSNFNVYYFGDVESAINFYLKKDDAWPPFATMEIDYVCNITNFMHSNYEICGYYNPIPEHNFVSEDNYIIFRQHGTQYYLKMYYEYLPFVNLIFKNSQDNYSLTIPSNVDVKIYEGYFNDDGSIATDGDSWTAIEKENKTYYDKRHWEIYSGKEVDYITYEIIYSTQDTHLSEYKDGQITINNDKMPVHILTDKDGKEYTHNTLTNTITKDGDLDVYKDPDGDGIYENSKGETIDINDLTDKTQEWLDSRQLDISLDTVIGAMKKFLDDVTRLTLEVQEFSKFLKYSIGRLPNEIITLISLGLIAMIIAFFIKTK